MAVNTFTPQVAPNGYTGFVAASGPVSLVRDIAYPGLQIGDIAITAAGAVYEWDGDSWNSLSIGGGGGAAQTPWAQNINGGGFNLTNAGDITLASTKRFSGIGAVRIFADGATLLAATPDYNGQIAVSTDGSLAVAMGTTSAAWLVGFGLTNTPLYFKDLNKGGFAGTIFCGALTATDTSGTGHVFDCTGGTFVDNTFDIRNHTGGYAAVTMRAPADLTNVAAMTIGISPGGAGSAPYAGSHAYLETNTGGTGIDDVDIYVSHYKNSGGAGNFNHVRTKYDSANKKTIFYGWTDGANFGPTAFEVLSTGVTAFTGAITGTLTGASSLNVLKAGDTMTGLLTLTQATANTGILASTGYSLTGSNATGMIDLAGSWNTSGNPVALKIAISNGGSGATAKFLSFLAGAAGATEVFSVDKIGHVITQSASEPCFIGYNTGATAKAFFLGCGTGASGFEFSSDNSGLFWISPNTKANVLSAAFTGTPAMQIDGSGNIQVRSTTTFAWNSTASANGTADTILVRDAANTLALRNGVNAQRMRIYNTFTTLDTSGEWLKIDWQVTANQCRIGTVMGTSAGTARVLSLDYGALSAAPTAAITIPITSGPIIFGGQAYAPTLRTAQTTVANLPAAGTAGAGATAFVTDSLTAFAAALGAAVVGGGANKVTVFSDGTNWIVG